MDILHNLSLVFCGNSAWSASMSLQRKLVFVSSQWDRKHHWTSVDLYYNFLGCVCFVNSESVQAVGLRCWGETFACSHPVYPGRDYKIPWHLSESVDRFFFSSPLFHCGYGPLLSLLLCRFLLPLHNNSHPLILAWCHTAVASNSPSMSQEKLDKIFLTFISGSNLFYICFSCSSILHLNIF